MTEVGLAHGPFFRLKGMREVLSPVNVLGDIAKEPWLASRRQSTNLQLTMGRIHLKT